MCRYCFCYLSTLKMIEETVEKVAKLANSKLIVDSCLISLLRLARNAKLLLLYYASYKIFVLEKR